MPPADPALLDQVARGLGNSQPSEPPSADSGASLLLRLARAYGAGEQPLDGESTQPTGFNPHAAALFEAVIEGGFLVASADGSFDALERSAFIQVVEDACLGAVSDAQLAALLSDLADLLAEDGLERRLEVVAKTIRRPEHAEEVLRVAGLLAHVSAGISSVERGVITRLATQLGVGASRLDEILRSVAESIATRKAGH